MGLAVSAVQWELIVALNMYSSRATAGRTPCVQEFAAPAAWLAQGVTKTQLSHLICGEKNSSSSSSICTVLQGRTFTATARVTCFESDGTYTAG
jgi:hypothetical protein